VGWWYALRTRTCSNLPRNISSGDTWKNPASTSRRTYRWPTLPWWQWPAVTLSGAGFGPTIIARSFRPDVGDDKGWRARPVDDDLIADQARGFCAHLSRLGPDDLSRRSPNSLPRMSSLMSTNLRWENG
jgi:hypothetical protein